MTVDEMEEQILLNKAKIADLKERNKELEHMIEGKIRQLAEDTSCPTCGQGELNLIGFNHSTNKHDCLTCGEQF